MVSTNRYPSYYLLQVQRYLFSLHSTVNLQVERKVSNKRHNHGHESGVVDQRWTHLPHSSQPSAEAIFWRLQGKKECENEADSVWISSLRWVNLLQTLIIVSMGKKVWKTVCQKEVCSCLEVDQTPVEQNRLASHEKAYKNFSISFAYERQRLSDTAESKIVEVITSHFKLAIKPPASPSSSPFST